MILELYFKYDRVLVMTRTIDALRKNIEIYMYNTGYTAKNNMFNIKFGFKIYFTLNGHHYTLPCSMKLTQEAVALFRQAVNSSF